MLRETRGVTNHLIPAGSTGRRSGEDRIRYAQRKPEKRSQYTATTRAASSVVTILLILIVVAARQRESAHLQVLGVHALTEDDIDYTIYAYPLYQGDPAGMNISVVSRSTDDTIIDWIGLQFEWMNKTDWIFKDLSIAPVTVPSLGEADMGAFSFTVPAATPQRYPTLLIRIEYDEETSNGTLDRGNLSMLYNVEIHSTEEKHYQELLPTLSQAIEAANSETLLSPSAKNLLQQAETEYYDAISEGQESEWTMAYNSLHEAQTLLAQTKDDENRFRTGLTIGTLAVGALTGIVLITKLRQKT